MRRRGRRVCVDNHAVVREAIRAVIAQTAGFVQIGEAGSGEDAISALAMLRPDLVLVDVHLPGIDGFETTSLLLEADPDLVVALMSGDPIAPPAKFAPPAGSVLFVPKGQLCPRRLRDLWQARPTGRSAPAR